MLTATVTDATRARAAVAGAGLVQPGVARALVLAGIGGGLVLGLLAANAGQTAQAVRDAGPDLARLLRAMAAIKGVMAAGAVAALLWRLGRAIGPVRLAPYVAACAAMAAGPALIWQMAHVGAGALLLHGGLLACGLLLWRDPATAAMLQAVLDRRRAARI